MAATSPRPACTADQMQAVTRDTDAPLLLDCSVILQDGQSILRPVRLEGLDARGVVIDCKGGTLGRRGRAVSTSQPTLAIWSQKQANGSWERPSDIVVRNCHVQGNIRIWGMGADGSYDDLRHSSRSLGHVERLQEAAPNRILLQNLTLTANGSIPLYVGPGVTEVFLDGSTLNGTTSATAIYLDAESARNRITNNRILTRTGREMLAIDGSAQNTITGNRFDLHGQAGIYLYRNCGERGVVRHQTPSDNTITGNSFTGASWLRPRLVVENARNGRRSYCGDDAGYSFGSSADDRDNASGNTIQNNRKN